MSGPPRTSRSERILHEDLGDSKPPAIQRKSTVNPQEANGVLARKKNDLDGSSIAVSPAIHHQMKAPLPESHAAQYGTQGLDGRVALDGDSHVRPAQAPERKEPPPPPTAQTTAPPTAIRYPSRRGHASCSDASASSSEIPVPLSLTYNETVHISNTTTTNTTAVSGGTNSASGTTPTALTMNPKLPPNPPQLLPPSKPPHPWTVLQLQQGYPMTAIESSSLEEDTSSRSNSLRTRSTIDTLELVLAQRYAAHRELPSSFETFDGGNADHNIVTMRMTDSIPPHHHQRPTPQMQRRSDVAGYSVSALELLLQEKTRQAGGYISQELDAYVSSSNNNNDNYNFARPFGTPASQSEWRNVNAHHRNFTIDGYTSDHVDNDGDTSLSTAPDPPSLRVRERVCMRPGAYRMSQGGEPRHVDNDSVTSSSLRTHSTMRTVGNLGIIEASLVVDEPLPKDEDEYCDDDAVPVNHYRHDVNSSNDDYKHHFSHDYECVTTDQTREDNECSSSPPPLHRQTSMGDVTFFSAVTGASHPVEARPFDDSQTIRAFFRSRKVRCMMCCLTLAFVALAVGSVYAVTGFVIGNDDSDNYSDEGGDENSSLITTGGNESYRIPTGAPTASEDLQLEYFVHVALPDYTLVALTDPNSPQSQALEWLRNNTNLESYPVSRRLQRFSLATLYFATAGLQRWSNNQDWLSDVNECLWYSTVDKSLMGNVCAEDEYRILSLHANELRGTLPPEMELLSSLELIFLDENMLTGFLPVSLGRLTNLKEIHLYDNYVSGTIPSEFGSLAQLEVLSLGYNYFEHTLPSSLGQLDSLRRLFVDRNYLVGSVPAALGRLSRLEAFYIYGNTFTGQIPPEFGGLTNLVDFQFDINRLFGSIPPEISNWKKLETLNLGNNTLTGSLPTEIGSMSELKKIDVFLNSLQGELPSEVGRLTKLEMLYMEQNSLVGTLPTEIGNLLNVTILILYSNKLKGRIPNQIGRLTGLTDLDLSENSFGGGLPTEMGLLTNIESLNLQANFFSGLIPSELGLLTNARTIQLDDNQFSGTMPAELCALVYDANLPLQNLTVNCTLVECFCCTCNMMVGGL